MLIIEERSALVLFVQLLRVGDDARAIQLFGLPPAIRRIDVCNECRTRNMRRLSGVFKRPFARNRSIRTICAHKPTPVAALSIMKLFAIVLFALALLGATVSAKCITAKRRKFAAAAAIAAAAATAAAAAAALNTC